MGPSVLMPLFSAGAESSVLVGGRWEEEQEEDRNISPFRFATKSPPRCHLHENGPPLASHRSCDLPAPRL